MSKASQPRAGHDDRRGARRWWIAFAAGLEGFNVPIVYVIFAPDFATRVASDPAAG